ncbi:hypothetical protein FITA111629_08600 [Filibacter tadaridae]|uniref:Uncharacterized protein n=1 Tax=Filibacter tadaridae TaxID=2483811 RepID=A0A3P5WWI1_9BACL|nr:hypothetical protein FILTAD_01425 [Filibacter tadaridae]
MLGEQRNCCSKEQKKPLNKFRGFFPIQSGTCARSYSDNTLQLHIYEIKVLMSNIYRAFIQLVELFVIFCCTGTDTIQRLNRLFMGGKHYTNLKNYFY